LHEGVLRGKEAVASNLTVTFARSSLITERERQGGGLRVSGYRGGISVSAYRTVKPPREEHPEFVPRKRVQGTRYDLRSRFE
jgi:hypothetical protein